MCATSVYGLKLCFSINILVIFNKYNLWVFFLMKLKNLILELFNLVLKLYIFIENKYKFILYTIIYENLI